MKHFIKGIYFVLGLGILLVSYILIQVGGEIHNLGYLMVAQGAIYLLTGFAYTEKMDEREISNHHLSIKIAYFSLLIAGFCIAFYSMTHSIEQSMYFILLALLLGALTIQAFSYLIISKLFY